MSFSAAAVADEAGQICFFFFLSLLLCVQREKAREE